jgi:hypothetical protein
MSMAVSKSGSLNDCSDRLDMTLWNNIIGSSKQYSHQLLKVNIKTRAQKKGYPRRSRSLLEAILTTLAIPLQNPLLIILQVWH